MTKKNFAFEVTIRLETKKKSWISRRVIEVVYKKAKTQNIIKKYGNLSQAKFPFEKEKPFSAATVRVF